jgi:hypothetical protein
MLLLLYGEREGIWPGSALVLAVSGPTTGCPVTVPLLSCKHSGRLWEDPAASVV